MEYRAWCVVGLAAVCAACQGTMTDGRDAGPDPGDASPVRDASPSRPPPLADASTPGTDANVAAPDSTVSSCDAPFRAMVAHGFGGSVLGEDYLSWRRSVVDDTHSFSNGKAVRVRTNPGEELLPACSGGHFFAGRTRLPAPVPQGRTLWFRVYQYIPSEFSFGYKYSRNAGDEDEARACGQSPDGNTSLKWLVLAPDIGTARVYLLPSVARRALASSSPRIRIISEALHRPGDFGVDLPRDRWFALQIAVRVSDGDDGFIRAWLDDAYLGEVQGPTTVTGAALNEWGIGDYWNGVPWTDGRPGRTDFWIDDVIVASDADGYDPPTGTDDGGRTYIPPCVRAADLPD